MIAEKKPKIDLRRIIEKNIPGFYKKYPAMITRFIEGFLRKILQINKINEIIEKYSDKKGFEFIDCFFDYLNFSYKLDNGSIENIPKKGKLIGIANHPLGGLDGLAILKAIGEVRKDSRIVANKILLNIENLSPLFFAVDVNTKPQRKQIQEIIKALENDETVIMFPGAAVARLTLFGIREHKWTNGAFKFAKEFGAPILPIYVKGKNSMLFYILSFLTKRTQNLLLSREVFLKRSKTISLKIGEPIYPEDFPSKQSGIDNFKKMLKKHLFRIGNGKPGIFPIKTKTT